MIKCRLYLAVEVCKDQKQQESPHQMARINLPPTKKPQQASNSSKKNVILDDKDSHTELTTTGIVKTKEGGTKNDPITKIASLKYQK